jgi:hypothetical protein
MADSFFMRWRATSDAVEATASLIALKKKKKSARARAWTFKKTI